MVKSILCGLLLSAFAPQLTAADAGNDKGVPELIVRIYNYAGVGEDFLPRAQQEAAGIFLEVGIRLSWLSCTPTLQGTVDDQRCHQRGPNVVSLMICPEAMLPKGGLPRGIFGFALMPQPGEPATYARLYFHRLAEVADGRKVRLGVLLGAMMAHEIGHLLLGANSHSGEGIMSIPWDAHKLQQVDLGGLGFTPGQAAALKAEALRRASGLPEDAPLGLTDHTEVSPVTKLSLALAIAPLLLGNPPVLATQLAPKTPRPLTLRVYDHAKIDPHILRQSQNRTAWIFRQFGIEIGWLDCPTSPQQFQANLACQVPLGPTDFVVRILPESMSKQSGLPKGVFGYTLPTSKGRIGRTANVFYARVFDMAFYGPVPGGFENAQGVILGHGIAHEIGHLLLGPGSHSETGIMSFPWGRKQLLDASRGLVRFTPEQVRNILSKLDDLFAEGGDSVEGDR